MAITQARMLKLIMAGEELRNRFDQLLRDLDDFVVAGKSCEEFVEFINLSGAAYIPHQHYVAIELERAHYNRTASANADNRIRQQRYRRGEPQPVKLTREKFAGTLPTIDPRDAKTPGERSRNKGHFHSTQALMTRDEQRHQVPQQYVDALRGAKSPEEVAAEQALRAFQQAQQTEAVEKPWEEPCEEIPADAPPGAKDDDLPF